MNDVSTFAILLKYNILDKDWKIIIKCEQTDDYVSCKIEESDAIEILKTYALITQTNVQCFWNVSYSILRGANFKTVDDHCDEMGICEDILQKVVDMCIKIADRIRSSIPSDYFPSYWS